METLSKKRVKKYVTLSETTIQYVKEYAEMNDISNFSRAIEALALMSLRDQRVLGVVQILTDVIRRESMAHYNRFAKLLVHASLEAGAAKEAAQHVYFLLLLNEMEQMEEEAVTVDDLESFLAIDRDSMSGKALIAFYKKRVGRFRYRSVKSIRKPIEQFQDILDEMDVWEEAMQMRTDEKAEEDVGNGD